MKVFISSTYKDLIDYRAAAICAVEIYTRLRLPDDVQSAQETLAEIEKAMAEAK